MKSTTLALAAALALGGGLIGCTTAPETQTAKETLSDRAEVSLKAMERNNPEIRRVISRGFGYAIFPEVGKGGALVGGAFGRGEVYQEGKFVGYAKIEQATVGAQVGGQSYDMLMVFENAETMMKFKNNEWTGSANASAVILKEGAGASTDFKNGVAVYVRPTGGAMAEASLGGQKFSFEAASKRSMD
ncbi:lipid-binding SYLF domain-containing protein [Humisphaera borealis]|uniref:Lipid-binding SYLF domain-containing protein n=1 Tax=Humisphaera borealis TaxID=2807512 RepID=A0A7M2X2L0_9BACT|nr:lipid-binding SYLF domain-containing protein [Humisphaera borealis]QOV91281.1 lipid-binding SYLF domain-containing protein [Humisphaera borealis]